MKDLVLKAKEAMENAYAPYSNFKVGAAILLKDGNIIKGCNVENISYGLTNCAERTALFTAYANGVRKDDIKAIAIIGNTNKPLAPCGACRQVIQELMPLEADVILANTKGDTLELKNSDLLPHSFEDLT